MAVKTPKRVLKKIEGIVRKAVEERFKGEFVFDPILVVDHPDAFDEDRIHIYVIYDGKKTILDPGWTLGLTNTVLRQVTEEEVPTMPFHEFIHKSEWKRLRKQVEQWIPQN